MKGTSNADMTIDLNIDFKEIFYILFSFTGFLIHNIFIIFCSAILFIFQ